MLTTSVEPSAHGFDGLSLVKFLEHQAHRITAKSRLVAVSQARSDD